MKYNLYIDDIFMVDFSCEEIKTHTYQCGCNRYDCRVENKIACCKQHVIKQLEKDCLIQNFVKWKYLIKNLTKSIEEEKIEICNDIIKYENIKISIEQLKKELGDKYEDLDIEEINAEFEKSLKITNHGYTRLKKKTCAKCGNEFQPTTKYHILCNTCYYGDNY